MRVRVRTCVCAHMCVCVCINNEIAPFSGFLLSHYVHIPYILANSLSFFSCRTMFMFLFVQVTWQYVERSIT